MRRKHSGFTLIELLVVIAIIAILAAILFPTLTKAKETSRASHCMNNLKQLGQAMKLYGNDWGGKFPEPSYEWGVYPDLTDSLKKYAPGKKVFKCPSDIGEKIVRKDPPSYFNAYHTSYNWPASNYRGSWPQLAGLSQENPVDPNAHTYVYGTKYDWIWNLPLSKRPMLFDGRCWHFTVYTGGDWNTVRGFINVCFVDGHCKIMEYQKLLDYLWGDKEPK